MSEELKALLRAQAVEIAVEGYLSWGNTMVCAAAAIDERDARIAEMQERFDSSAHRTSLIGRLEIENAQLSAELAAIKAQEPVPVATIRQDSDLLWQVDGDPSKWRQLGDGTKLYATPVSESKAQGVGSPIRFWIIGDAGQKKGATLCKKSSRDGSLAFFETEEDATRAAKRHAGTAVYSVDYYKSAPLMMPERSNECGSDGELTYEAKAQDFDPLVCDYCNAETQDPWHGSGMLNGAESHHIHACNQCRNLLPPTKAQGVVMPPSPYMPGSQPTDFTDYELGEIHGRIAMWEEVKRLNAAPVQQVSVARAIRYTSDGELAECPCCGSLDVGGAHDTVNCYGCGLKITKPRPLQNAADAWNRRSMLADPAVPAADGWISVSERLPGEDDQVLCWCEDETVAWAEVSSHHNSFFTDMTHELLPVTHWTPLPAEPAAHRAKGVV